MIDAKIQQIFIDEDGSGRLRLVDRPARKPGEPPGVAGQGWLRFDAAPECLPLLAGREILGDPETITLGGVIIADRVSSAGITFRHAEEIRAALASLNKWRRPRVEG